MGSIMADTLTVLTSHDTTTVITAPVGSGASGLQWAQLTISVLTLAIGGVALFQWREQYVTKEWSNTLQFLLKYPRFYRARGNEQYKTSYQGDESARYELVARMSISYVDDLYNLKLQSHLHDWLAGSIRVFVYPHRTWFRDNKSSYSEEFFYYVDDKLRRMEREIQ